MHCTVSSIITKTIGLEQAVYILINPDANVSFLFGNYTIKANERKQLAPVKTVEGMHLDLEEQYFRLSQEGEQQSVRGYRYLVLSKMMVLYGTFCLSFNQSVVCKSNTVFFILPYFHAHPLNYIP